ncbi:MAG: hypothetical protein K2P79_07690 [Sphingomonas sp.]|nr:hypothetical protein [Sphingomonas sp.]
MLGKPDALDRIVQVLLVLVALFAIIFGVFMLVDPYGWYQAVPTVRFTGPPNPHFIRDIGLAYLITGTMLGYAAWYPQGRWLAALTGTLWLSAHGIFHLWEVANGICSPDRFWSDAPGVLGPPLIVWIAIGTLFVRQKIVPAGLPKPVMLRAIDQMSPDESAYFHEVAKAPGHAFEKFVHFMPVTMHRYEAPADLFHMARIGATLVEDCGPCAMTAAEGALRDGVDRALLNAALARNLPEGDPRTGFLFGESIARQQGDAFALGDAIEAKFGRDVRLELAMTAATVRAYPAMKRGLGLTKSCSIMKLEI